MKTKPKVLILKADGVNRDEELAYAFTIAGGDAKIVHVNDLRFKQDNMNSYQIIAVPGGFAYGDDVVSGKILATELTTFFAAQLQKFISRKDTAIIGICNGFQVLIRTGILPFDTVGEMDATLIANDSGRFECRWVQAKFEKKSRCVFVNGLENTVVDYPVAHGEGKFFTDKKTLRTIEKERLVVLRYVDEKGKPTQSYPQNPNGSVNGIVGICDMTGRALGLMPHPECFVRREQHPNWRRQHFETPQGLPLFVSMVEFVKQA